MDHAVWTRYTTLLRVCCVENCRGNDIDCQACKIVYHMQAFSMFSKGHTGHVNHGNLKIHRGVGVSPTFIAGDAVFLLIFCGVAVFRALQCPSPRSSGQLATVSA